MPRFQTKALERALSSNSKLLLQDYRAFQEKLRKQKNCPLAAETAEEHLRLIQHRHIENCTERCYVREVLKFHDWVCEQDEKLRHELEVAHVLCLFDQFYKYCKFKTSDQKMQSWTLNKTCQAVLSWVKFMRTHAKRRSPKKDMDDMIKKVRDLYAGIRRKMQASLKNRPSLCELREQGKALSFLDIIKVHEAQHLRVAILLKHLRSGGNRRHTEALLREEVKRLAVLSTLLRRPTRNHETQKCVINVISATAWRLKLQARERKSGRYPIDVKLSALERKLFSFLRSGRKSQSWKPFEQINVSNVLKEVTSEMTGVGVTASGLRSAAESHAELLGDANIRSALSYAEGHSTLTAKTFYMRNGAELMMKSWQNYVRGLIHQDCDEDEDVDIDQQILESIKNSQKRWLKNIEKQLRSKPCRKRGEPKSTQRKRRAEWTEEQDNELRKRIRIHGEGNWKEIVNNSDILRSRYQGFEETKARMNVKTHWRTIKRQGGNISVALNHQWLVTEDNALEAAVSMYPDDWVAIRRMKIFREMVGHLPANEATEKLKRRYKWISRRGRKRKNRV